MKPRRLTIANAVDQWCETTLAIKGLTPLQKEAREILVAHGERTGRRTWKDRIAMEQTGGNVVLDQALAVEFLVASGQDLRDFQKLSQLGWTLKLLK